MSKNDVASDAQKSAAEVSQHRGNADDAYKSLMTEVKAEEKKLGGADSQQYKDYVKSLTADLKQSGVLPELTLEWAKSNESNIFNKKDGDGHLKKFDTDGIDKYLKSNSSDFGTSTLNPMDIALAGNLKSSYKNLTGSNDGISDNDITKDIKASQSIAGDGDFYKALFGSKTDPNGAIDLIDTASKGGKADGTISKNDVKQFLNNKDANERALKGEGYTDQQIETIETTLRSWEKNWGNDDMKNGLEDSHGNIKVDKLATSLGYANIGDVTHAAQTGTLDQVPAAPTTSTDSSTTPTSATTDNPNDNGSGRQPSHKPTETQLTATAKSDITTDIVNSSLVHKGDGYQAVAAKILPKGAPESEVVKLGEELQKLNGNKDVIYTSDHLLTAAKVNKLLAEDSVFAKYYNMAVSEAVHQAQAAQQ